MYKMFNREKKSEILFIIILLIANILLLLIPNNYQKDNDTYTYTVGKVISVDNSEVGQYGIIRQGEQYAEIEVLRGERKGEIFETNNQLIGKMELDKFLKAGDTVYVEMFDARGRTYLNVVDFYRLGTEGILFGIFVIILIIYAGWTGIKTVLSFSTSLLMIWKVMIPLFLQGYDPVFLAFWIVLALTAVVIFLVGGFEKKGIVAFLGAGSGVLITLILSQLFSDPFIINGSVMPFSETLLNSGFANLNLNKLFLASVFIGSSGAVMDIGMDLSAAMKEIVDKHPKITVKELTISGLNIGRAVVGTMSTTLLFAYAGGYLTLLMAFMAQGVNAGAMLNLNYFSSEIFKTIIGSFGLVLTAPFTAIIGAIIYKLPSKQK
ncbi:MAG TPA: YibE/F family protein [Thermotogota bacterium]|nr:YibE/F family protein [Thermotogota bacterium]